MEVEPAASISRLTGVRPVISACILLGVMAISACSSSHSGASATATVGTPAVVNGNPQSEPAARISTAIRKPAVVGTNRALAVAAAARAFRHFPVPPGSTRVKTAPRHAPHLRRLSAYVGPVDTSLTRTGWWLVPLRYGRLVAWYTAHTGAYTGSAYVFGATRPSPDAGLDWQTRDASPAYSAPVDVVAYTQLGPHLTALRTDVTLAARADRTAKTLVPATVASIDITKRAIDGPNTAPTTVTVTDHMRVLAVVAAFDALKGDFARTEAHPCGSPVGIVYTYAVTFHWPAHTLVVDPGHALCGVGRELTLDGSHLPQTLQDDSELDNALRAAIGGSER